MIEAGRVESRRGKEMSPFPWPAKEEEEHTRTDGRTDGRTGKSFFPRRIRLSGIISTAERASERATQSLGLALAGGHSNARLPRPLTSRLPFLAFLSLLEDVPLYALNTQNMQWCHMSMTV